MSKENAVAVVITDESLIENALSTIWTERMGVGGCNALGGSFIGGMHNKTIDRSALSKAHGVVKDAHPEVLARVQKYLKRKENPTSADFAGVI